MKTKKLFIAITALSILTINFNILKSQDKYEVLKEDFRKEISKKMKKRNLKGASIILVQGDSTIWEEYFGFENVEQKHKLDENSLFKIGSITKLFTATGIMMQVQNNEMLLDEPVSKYLPEFAINQRFENIPEITPRMVLTHHAGLPCDIMRGFESDSVEDYTKELDYLNNEYTIYPPNYIRAYSNPGYNLMGIVAGKIANTSYMEYIKENVFKPLEIQNSYFWTMDKKIEKLCMNYNSKGKAVHEPFIREIPAGGIVSNVRDLSKFVIEWLPENSRENLLSDAYKNEMLTVQNEGNELDLGDKYGLGWMIKDSTKAGRIYKHSGATFYHNGMLAIAPQINAGVVILTNSTNGGSVYGLYDEILEKLAELNGTSVEERNEKTYNSKKLFLSESESQDFLGKYAFPGGFYEVGYKKGKAFTSIQNMNLDLISVGNKNFIPKVKILGPIGFKIKKVRFRFEEINGQKLVIQEQTTKDYMDIIGVKIEPTEITEEWKNRFGKYKITNSKTGDFEMFTDFELSEKSGFLQFSYNINLGKKSSSLKPVLIIESDELAYVAGLGRQGGYAVQVKIDKNGNEFLSYSGYEMVKMKAE